MSEPFKALCNEGTFTSLFRALPLVLTSSLFLVFDLFGIALACLKWTLFVVILGMAFIYGLLLLLMAITLMVALVGLVIIRNKWTF